MAVQLAIALALTILGGMPQQVDTIRVGHAALGDVLLPTGTERIESFKRTDEGSLEQTSTTARVISRERLGGIEVFVIQTIHRSNDTTRTEIVVRADDFGLIHHRVKASLDSAAVTVADGFATGWVVLPGQPISLVDRNLDHPVFPIEGQMPWIFPMLPLEEGYEAVIPHFSIWDAGEAWKTIKVVGSESVEHAGESKDCWIVDRGPLGPPGHRAYAWVEKTTRRILKTELRSEDGTASYWARTLTKADSR